MKWGWELTLLGTIPHNPTKRWCKKIRLLQGHFSQSLHVKCAAHRRVYDPLACGCGDSGHARDGERAMSTVAARVKGPPHLPSLLFILVKDGWAVSSPLRRQVSRSGWCYRMRPPSDGGHMQLQFCDASLASLHSFSGIANEFPAYTHTVSFLAICEVDCVILLCDISACRSVFFSDEIIWCFSDGIPQKSIYWNIIFNV